jgi:glucokinase
MVAKAASEGDDYAKSVWDTAIKYLGIGVANIVSIINPDMVVLGGGVTKAGDMLFEPVRETVKKRAMGELAKIVRIVPAGLGDNVGIVGAVAVALEAMDAAPLKDFTFISTRS